MNRLFLSLVLFCLPMTSLLATHQMGGHIEMEHINGLAYRLTVKTFSDPAPAGVDRCAADIEVWKIDATGNTILVTTLADIPRHNGAQNTGPVGDCVLTSFKVGEVVYQSYKRNLYDTTYTFPGPGVYELRYTDMNRTSSILNVPDADNTPLYISLVAIVDSLQDEPPQLLNESIFALACAGTPWQYSPIAFDPDGDSLAYAIEPVWEYSAPLAPQVVNGYQFPDDMALGGGTFQIDPNTGLVSWDTPSIQGLYVFAIRLTAYRNGQFRSETLQEVPIIVTACNNTPPNIVPNDTDGREFVFPGQSFDFSFSVGGGAANDSLYVAYQLGDRPNTGNFTQEQNNFSLLVSAEDASQGAFTQDSLPIGLLNTPSVAASVQLNLSWTPDSADWGKDFQYDILAHNNLSYLNLPNEAMLTAYQSIRFSVLDPVPVGVSAQANSWGGITINWTDLPYDTAQFYRIYRVKSELPELDGNCEVREDTANFEYLGYTTSWAPKSFGYIPLGIDQQTLCYVVTAAKGNSWNISSESCPSEVTCVEAFTTSIGNIPEVDKWILEVPLSMDGFALRNMSGQIKPMRYLVIDTQGRSVLQGSTTQDQIEVNTPNLAAGMYWVLVMQEGGRQSLPYLRR
ncbi:MAG: hypothetical protein AAF927_03065 [Bacteroidota bacterium]